MTNLDVLAQAATLRDFGRWGNKLNISESGKFSLVQGAWAALNRDKQQSFTGAWVQTKIRSEFDAALANVPLTPIQDGALVQLTAICKAFRGFVNISRSYKNDRRESAEIDNTLQHIFAAIKGKIKEILLHTNNIHVSFCDSQRTFLPNADYSIGTIPSWLFHEEGLSKKIDLVDNGICWGIACKWCARWVVGKKSFLASKKGSIIPFGFFSDDHASQMRQDQKMRLHKKSVEMFVLMHNQDKLRTVGGTVSDALKMFSAANVNNYKLRDPSGEEYALADLSRNDAAQIAFDSAPARDNKDASAQSFIARKQNAYNNLKLAKTKMYAAVSISQFVGPKETEFSVRKDKIMSEASCFDGSAYMVYWIKQKVGNQEGSGHAMAIAHDVKDGKWFFMDPNYGEWSGDKALIENVLSLIMSLYSFSWGPEFWGCQRMYWDPIVPMNKP